MSDRRIRWVGPAHVEISAGYHGTIVIDEHGIRQRLRRIGWPALHSIRCTGRSRWPAACAPTPLAGTG